MPELPEVETVARSLRPTVVGRKLLGVAAGPKALRTVWRPEWAGDVLGRRMTDVRRRGKWILVSLSRTKRILVLHLGMTGRISVEKSGTPLTDHTHLVFSLDQGVDMRFHDPRRFGSITVVPDLEAFEARASLGPEPFDITTDVFHASVSRGRRALKAILLDQCVVAGLGNIYADETLFEGKLDPRRRGASMTRAESDRLRKAMVNVLRRAIESKGSTIANFYFGAGEQGGYQNRFRVYGRTGKACRRCDGTVKRVRLGGRSTHFCPGCQK